MTTQDQVELEIQSNEQPFGYEPPPPETTNQPQTQENQETQEKTKESSDIQEFELRPSIYNLLIVTRLNFDLWDKLPFKDRFTLWCYTLITPVIQIILILMSARTPSAGLASTWVSGSYSRRIDERKATEDERNAPEDSWNSGRVSNYKRTYRTSMNDIFMIFLLFASCVYIGNEIAQILYEVKAIKRMCGISEKQIKDSEYKGNLICIQCNLFCAPYKRIEFNIIYLVKIVMEFYVFVGGSIAYMLFTLDATQVLYWSDDADQFTRYTDAVLNLLAFVFIFEIDDWVFDRVCKADLTPLSGHWDDDLLKLKIDKKEDELGPLEKLLFWGFFLALVLVYYIILGLSDTSEYTELTSPFVIYILIGYAVFWTYDAGYWRFPCCSC